MCRGYWARSMNWACRTNASITVTRMAASKAPNAAPRARTARFRPSTTRRRGVKAQCDHWLPGERPAKAVVRVGHHYMLPDRWLMNRQYMLGPDPSLVPIAVGVTVHRYA